MPLMDTFGKAVVRVFGSANERKLRPMLDIAGEVNRLEPRMRRMSDKSLQAQTAKFKKYLGEKLDLSNGFTREEADLVLEDILVEAFATAREAGRRVLTTASATDRQPMRHFDVQLVGGVTLHEGNIAEMVTGEGKTLVATLPAYLNALLGKGVHIITVNDFLAMRDRNWMAPLYEFLGMTAGAIQSDQDYEEKRAAYFCDVTFGYDSEFGFDYLRDNMRWSHDEQVQLDRMYYAIVDEVDSVLIDESRTPLIISGPAEESTEKYYRADGVARKLKKGLHYEVKEKEQTCRLTEVGVQTVERLLGVDSIYSGRNTDWPHHIEQSLRAHNLQRRDVDYVVKEGEIVIVDEFTGRLQPGRRWADGLHQAIEAKERLHIKEENQTLATVTYQNFFRLYQKLAGMTGTALTEATEFQKIYRLDVNVIPTNRPLIRREHADVVYRTEREKWNAAEEEIVRQHATGRPLLVGTISIENSEMLSGRLQRRGIKHNVLNAKHHAREAEIIAEAGQLGHVTIATNMAGRGTDIVLGTFRPEDLLEHWKANGLAPKDLDVGAPQEKLEADLLEFWACTFLDDEVLEKTPHEKWRRTLERHWVEEGLFPPRLCGSVSELGGLHIIGTERHEARRIDNQLRGRSGRQGDPGSSRFFVSLEDDVMRIFAGDRVKSILQRIGMTEGMAIESRMVSRAIERAQRKVEEYHFDMRKHLLEYDEVMDEQRKTIYGMRQKVLLNEDLRDLIFEMIEDVIYDESEAAVEGDAAPESRSGRPVLDWAHEHGVELRDDDWAKADRESFTHLFLERAIDAWAERSRRDVAAAAVSNVMNIACDEDLPFCRWDFSTVARWARRLHARAEAEDMRVRLSKAVMGQLTGDAERRFAEAQLEEVYERIITAALDAYLPKSSVGAEDWDYRGLQNWGEAMAVKIPVSQWQRVETDDSPVEEGAPDYTSMKRDEVRTWLEDRLPKQLKKREPLDIVQALLRHEAQRLLDQIVRNERNNYRDLVNQLDTYFDIGTAESDVRQIVQEQRQAILDDLTDQLTKLGKDQPDDAFRRAFFADMLATFFEHDLSATGRDFIGLSGSIKARFDIEIDPFELSRQTVEDLPVLITERVSERYKAREKEIGAETMRNIERYLLLQKIDSKWKDHLYNMDHLREGIGLRAYGQQDPKVEYTREARSMFAEMLASVRRDVADLVLKVTVESDERWNEGDIWEGGEAVHSADIGLPQEDVRGQQEAAIAGSQQGEAPKPIRKTVPAVGRNDPCPCGSGKKYKKCCGAA